MHAQAEAAPGGPRLTERGAWGRAVGRLDDLGGRRWAGVATALLALHLALLARFVARGDGALVTNDGLRYLDRARAVADGDLAFSTVEWRPLHFPPLYPLLLAVVDRLTPLSPTGAALLVNVLSVVALVVGLDRLLGLVF